MLTRALTDVVHLRPLHTGHVDAFRAHLDRDRQRLQTWIPEIAEVVTAEDARAWLEDRAGRGDDDTAMFGLWTADECVGAAAYYVWEPAVRTFEVGAWLEERFEGGGLAFAATCALVEHAFTACGMHRAEFLIDPANARAAATLGRIGARHEGHLRQSVWIGGAPRDQQLWALLAPEWRGRERAPAGVGTGR